MTYRADEPALRYRLETPIGYTGKWCCGKHTPYARLAAPNHRFGSRQLARNDQGRGAVVRITYMADRGSQVIRTVDSLVAHGHVDAQTYPRFAFRPTRIFMPTRRSHASARSA